jgi:hypothetical protein
MAGGGTSEAMKVSDVFILLGTSILMAGFLMHAWVEPVPLVSEEPGEGVKVEKSAMLFKNDKLLIDISVENGQSLIVTIVSKIGMNQLIPVEITNSNGNTDFSYEFTAEERTDAIIFIELYPSAGSMGEDGNTVNAEAIINVQRSLLYDFIVYPIGALLLSFGLYKRKEEQSHEAIDAELN